MFLLKDTSLDTYCQVADIEFIGQQLCNSFLNEVYLIRVVSFVCLGFCRKHTVAFYLKTDSVYLGCYNKIPKTGCLINNRSVLFTAVETGKAKAKAATHGPGKGCIRRCWLLAVPVLGAGARPLSHSPDLCPC